MQRRLLRSLVPVAVLMCAAACGSDDPQRPDDPHTVRLTVVLRVADLPQTVAWMRTAPPSVASVKVEVRDTDCAGVVLHADTVNVEEATDSVVFQFDLTDVDVACFRALAYSAQNAAGTLVFEGSTSGVDLTGGTAVRVEITLGLVGITPPIVTTLAATDVSATRATFHGSVVPMGFIAVGYFEWGLTTAYGSTTPVHVVGDGRAAVPIDQLVSGLEPEQTYHYRAVGVNSGHVVYGADAQFTTLAAGSIEIGFPELPPPAVTTGAATSVAGTTASLSGIVDPEGTNAHAYFEWGTDSTYGRTTPLDPLGTGTDPQSVGAALSGLSTGTTYHYRAVAFNAGGITVGADASFTTTGCVPGYDIPGNGQDEDCDGVPDNVTTCDAGLALNSSVALDAAAALGLCRQAANDSDWGVLSARWVLPDGAEPGSGTITAFHLGHGILPSFGPAGPQEGAAVLLLSSGTARRPTDPGFVDPTAPGGYEKGYTNNPPQNVSNFGVCPTPGQPHDAAGLEVVVRVPPNVSALSFWLKFYSSDHPDWVCTNATDQAVVMMDPAPAGSSPGNIAHDANGVPISASGLLPVAPGTDLTGTGYEGHRAWQWYPVTAPVTPGSVITLRFVIYDSLDGSGDSAILFDAFSWE